MTMDVAAYVMNKNTEMSVHTQLQTAQAEMNSKPTWSQSNIGKYIIVQTHGLFIQEGAGRKLYKCCKINGCQWKVIAKNHYKEDKYYNAIKPELKIERMVKYVGRTMKYSCCLFERHSYLLSCIARVLDSLNNYPGPTHHDFTV